MNTLPQVGDTVKITYYGVITAVRDLPEYEPHFEIDGEPTRHSLSAITELVVYDDPATTALMNSFARVSRSV